MKLILLQNIKDLGKEGDIVEVKDGYGRNFLLRKNLALIANEKNLRKREEILKEREEKLKKIKEKEEEVLKKLEGKEFEFFLKSTPKGEPFGSIGENEIRKELEEKFPEFKEIDFKILLEKPIKKFGRFFIEIVSSSGLKKKIKIILSKEE